ncbi:MAG TPA: PIG-L family deacetylase [Bryobacteraceae bacterium]|nr:PIG-L family deacetylase [Bryobacteraceae bacterium]
MNRIVSLSSLLLILLTPSLWPQTETRLENLRGKTILLFTPHPDDDTFCCAGTLALLARNGNNIRIVIYTNDDKGSYDPEMTSERLARIRMHEEEEACRILGIPKDHIQWLEYHDGMLEYANTRDLVEEVTRIIRQVRPEVVLSIDPGSEYVRWHKTDHRMAANNTMDAIRAAEWHLYFPNQQLHEGLEPWIVPQEYYFYVTPREANYWVNIDSVVEKKLDAAVAHVSQWEPSIHHYRPDWDHDILEKTKAEVRSHILKKDGHYVEAFRNAAGFNQE